MPHPTNTCLGEEEAVKEAQNNLEEAEKEEADAQKDFIYALASDSAFWKFVSLLAYGQAIKARKAADKALKDAEDALDQCMKCLVQ